MNDHLFLKFISLVPRAASLPFLPSHPHPASLSKWVHYRSLCAVCELNFRLLSSWLFSCSSREMTETYSSSSSLDLSATSTTICHITQSMKDIFLRRTLFFYLLFFYSVTFNCCALQKLRYAEWCSLFNRFSLVRSLIKKPYIMAGQTIRLTFAIRKRKFVALSYFALH